MAAPATEPLPTLTIDRLALVHVEPGMVGNAVVVLRAVCIGTMADIGDFTRLATCVDHENETVTPAQTAIDSDLMVPAESVTTEAVFR